MSKWRNSAELHASQGIEFGSRTTGVYIQREQLGRTRLVGQKESSVVHMKIHPRNTWKWKLSARSQSGKQSVSASSMAESKEACAKCIKSDEKNVSSFPLNFSLEYVWQSWSFKISVLCWENPVVMAWLFFSSWDLQAATSQIMERWDLVKPNLKVECG